MAKKRVGLTIDGLEDWQRWLATLEGEEVENMKSRILRKTGFRTLEHLDDYTPVRTTRLKSSMAFGDRDNVFKLQVGRVSYVFVGTAVSYAQYVNDGFTQKAGQFVPGFWKSGTFHYKPGYDGGMVLTGKVIPGAHMFEKALDDLEDDIPKIAEYEFRRLYRLLF
jgi:hypothetical protein